MINRALAVAQAMYPGNLAALENYLTTLPLPDQMTTGITWGDNLDLMAPVLPTASTGQALDKEQRTPDYFLERVLIR